MADEGSIETRIVEALTSARANMHRQRFYAAIRDFRFAEKLILTVAGDGIATGETMSARLGENTASMLQRLLRTGAEMRAARSQASSQTSQAEFAAVATIIDVASAKTPRQTEAIEEANLNRVSTRALRATSQASEFLAFRPAGLGTSVDDGSTRLFAPDPDPLKLPEELARYFFHDIPLGLADCLVQLEQDYDQAIAYYLRVLDYAFETGELPIAAPALWLRLAEAHLARGDAAYRVDNRERARLHYEMILKDGQPLSDSPLYDGGLGIMIAKVRAWLPLVNEEPNALATPSTPSARHLLALARTQQRLSQLDASLDVFGHDASWRPIFSFAYLQEVARGFAQVAAQANREYVANTLRAEEQTQNVRQLEQAVALGQAGEAVEAARLAETRRELEAAQEAERLARLRTRLADENEHQYRQVGHEIVALDQAIAWSNAAVGMAQRQSYRGLEWLGVSSSVQERDDLLHQLAGLRSTRAYELEIDRLRNAVRELVVATDVAAAQTRAARARLTTASINLDAARWRTQFSRENLAAAESRELSAEVFFDLAVFARQTAQIYLDRAIAAARQMELAFNFENNTEFRKIRADYGDLGGAGGLYAADLLLRDIDSFVHELVGQLSGKDQLLVESISLRREFPLQFLEFIRTGQMVFQTSLDQFHGAMPGAYNGRIKRVDLDLLTLGAGREVRASLSCAGVSSFRNAAGATIHKVHPSETMLLSPLKLEGGVSELLTTRARPNQLNMFENVGLGCSWRLELPLRANDIDLQPAADIMLLVTYVCRHDAALEAADRQNQPATGLLQLSVGLRDQGVNAAREQIWGVLENRGEAEFWIDPGWLPRYVRAPTVRAISLVCARRGGVAQALRVRFAGETVGDLQHVYEPEASGATILERDAAPGIFHAATVDRRWRLRLDPEENPDLAGTGGRVLNLRALHDITVVFTYQHAFREP